MTKRAATATPAAIKELEEAFAAEGISVRELVATINATRKDSMRHSTKDGSEVGADHVTRFKAAELLLNLKGLPNRGPALAAPLSASLASLLAEPEPESEDPLA